MAEYDAKGKLISPCMGCNKRSVGCHSKCFPYIFYRAKLNQLKRERRDYWSENGYTAADKDKHRRLKAMYMTRKRKEKH